MSTFGEIAEPISRTLWEDWEDSSQNLVKLKWLNSSETPLEIDTISIFEGRYLSDYIKRQSHNLQLIDLVPGINMHLFKVTANEYICTIRDYSVVQSSKIIELLKSYLLISKEVIAVQTKPLPEYLSTTSAHDCVIRTVLTNKHVSNSKFSYPRLEQPNIISGVSAGVISYRDHMGLSGTAIVCYIEHPGDYQTDKIQKLFEKFNFTENLKTRPSNVFSSNLYI